MNYAIIGCGLIGAKRLRALAPGDFVVITSDVEAERAAYLAREADKHNRATLTSACRSTTDWLKAAQDPSVDAVIVATTNDALAKVSEAALRAGKHVLVEKPAARNADELEPVLRAAEVCGRCAHVGFSLRYHPALAKAREIVDSDAVGPLMFIRGRYGHGGRVGYDKEWRSHRSLSGGGELIDQGVHLIDLSRWFLGDVSEVWGRTATYFWEMEVDDNAFMMMQSNRGQVAWLQVSCTEWKNMFCLEIYGTQGKLQVDGLGGSYGTERLSLYRMKPEMGPPETTIWEYPGEDSSWADEMKAFAADIRSGHAVHATLHDALEALKIVDRIYAMQERI